METPEIARRSLVKGAAWSVPLIALAAAAPHAAASDEIDCEYYNDFDNWDVVRTGGSFNTNTGVVGWLSGAPSVFVIQQDNNSTSSQATLTLSSELATVAGRTYSFDFRIQSNYGDPANEANWMRLQILAGTQSLYRGTTRNASGQWTQIPHTNWPVNPIPYQTLSASFVAAQTGFTTITYKVTVAERLGSKFAANDDIRVSVPRFARCL
ncbi:MAG: hypothetical protein ACTIA6_01175 [Pseudoclavibacter sp.]